MKSFAIILFAAALSLPAWAHEDHPKRPPTTAGAAQGTAAQGSGAQGKSGDMKGMDMKGMDMKGMDMKAMMDHCRQMMAQPSGGGGTHDEKMRRDCEEMMKSHEKPASGQAKPQGTGR